MNANIGKSRRTEVGFALVTTLLLLILVTGLAIAVMYLATSQKQIAGSDSETSEAYYGGEAAMEKMMADLADLYQQKQTPSLADLAALSSQYPSLPGISYSDPNVTNAYTVSALDNGSGFPASYSSTVASGPNQGLIAQIIPINLAVTARRTEGTEVRMFRKVEVALIPVFQFGVFCDADCSYFPGPDFQFAGRVHTNGNLWLAAGGTLTFYDKITAYGNVIRKQLANTYDTSTGSYGGTINIPTASSGCGTYPSKSGSKCAGLAFDQGSVTNGNYCGTDLNSAPNCDSTSSKNSKWTTISGPGGTYGSMLLNGDTTVTKLSLPFVGTNVSPIEIIRRAQSGDNSTLSASRLYNQASIRILLDDNPYNLSSTGPADPDNIPLAAVSAGGKVDSSGWGTLASGKTYYFATATNASDLLQTVTTGNKTTYGPDPNWVVPSTTSGLTANPAGAAPTGAVDPFTYQPGAQPGSADGKQTVVYPETTLGATKATDWPLLSGWLRVEIQTKVGAKPVGVTREWLSLGFTRQFSDFPNNEASHTNTAAANAIILLQQEMNSNRIVTAYDKKGNATSYGNSFNPKYTKTAGYNLLPINFYDPREGELRDTTSGKAAGSCAINGLMNAVEIDVGNLNKWLKGSIGISGTSVDNTTYNGYILYFSDRRGGSKDGGYDYLDTVNATNSINVSSSPTASKNVTTGIPDGVLSAEEDVYQGVYPTALGGTGILTTPPRYIGSAFGLGQITTSSPGVSQRISCATTGEWNVVLAPRHALRLVNGSLGNVPKSAAGTGGFTVASEQPVYVVGNYNANAANPLPQTTTTDSAAAVIADTVTLLSTQYDDDTSLKSPFTPTAAKDSYYRLAIASGKTLTFKRPSSSDPQDFGTDGGVHNFLRYIENWNGANLYYEGSMVSLYYSAYATGAFKCCTTVYNPPSRHYSFDTNFLTPSLLPPGTPQFKDVVDLGFQQSLTP